MPISRFSGPAIARMAVSAVAALIILGPTVVFRVQAPANNNNIIQQWEKKDVPGSSTGAVVGYITGSGSTAFSGSTIFADQKSGSGRIRCGGSDGCALVLNDADGSGCWAIEVNNGTIITHGVPVAECP